VADPRFGRVVDHDLAEYRTAGCADVVDLQAHRIDEIDEEDARVNPMGSKGIGEIGVVGTAAALADAAHHATGTRVRDLAVTSGRSARAHRVSRRAAGSGRS
jgi:xanthine dehydrogenase YagR molybdenum-binding subunit